MKHKVSELEGALLDAAVALAEGVAPKKVLASVTFDADTAPVFRLEHLPYSRSWQHGGAIIDRERMEFAVSSRESGWWANPASDERGFHVGAWGPNHLVAAMRAYVASKLGEEVELP